MIARGTLLGEPEQALAESLPAATAIATPLAMTFFTAWSSASESPPPSDMLATAGFTALAASQSTPAITPALEPEPLQPSTRTECTVAFLATP